MSDFSDIDNLLDSMGKRHPRTLLCELEPDFDSAVAAKVEEGLRALAEQSGVDAPIATYVDEVVAGNLTAQGMMDAILARDTKPETA